MKKLIYIIPLALATVLCGCSEFTDIKPKGKNSLEEVEDLNQVLNYPFRERAFEFREAMTLVNDMMPDSQKIPDMLKSEVSTAYKALYTWDKTIDRAELAVTDPHYEGFYKIINTVANPVLFYVGNAKGDKSRGNQYKAEAYILRAYMHYLAVNFYAKAYNPATAATDPGVPFIDEFDMVNEPAVKLTVKEVYDRIMSDIDNAFALNSLVKTPINKMRVGKCFALGVKARVLMDLRDYKGALKAAEEALAEYNVIDDHHDHLVENGGTGVFTRPEMQSKEDIFYASFVALFAAAHTPELYEAYEPGNIFFDIYPRGTNYGQRFYNLPDLNCFASTNIIFNNAGLTTVDLYLIKAECLIREGELGEGMRAINTIREKRVYKDFYQPLTASTQAEAMKHLKYMSRTENFFSYKNFVNLKRWNTEDAYKETLHKKITIPVVVDDNTTYETYEFSLSPDSPLWIFPFPKSATDFNPNLIQNY